jgi:hypothetical protein
MDSARRSFLTATNNEVRFFARRLFDFGSSHSRCYPEKFNLTSTWLRLSPRLLLAILGDKRSGIGRAAVRGRAPVVTSAGLVAKIEFWNAAAEIDSLLQLPVEARRPELRRLLFSRLGVELFVSLLLLYSLGRL